MNGIGRNDCTITKPVDQNHTKDLLVVDISLDAYIFVETIRSMFPPRILFI
jgi:hypothetical protein